MSLVDYSIHKLRAIAQGISVPNVFEKDKKELIQEIEFRGVTEAKAKEQPPVVVFIEQNGGEQTDPNDIVTALEPFIKRGLKVDLSADSWRIRIGDREDSGSLSVPLRVIVKCARALF